VANGLPWVGRGPGEPSPKNNFTPWPSDQAPTKAQTITGDESISQFVHPSLQGEVHPDQPGTGAKK
jgi:hypothetical protein